MKSLLTENSQVIANGITLILSVALLLAPVIVWSVRGASSIDTWIVTWIGISVWGVLECLVVPWALYRFTGDKSVLTRFPDAPGAGACIILGPFIAGGGTMVVKGVVWLNQRKNP